MLLQKDLIICRVMDSLKNPQKILCLKDFYSNNFLT